MLWHPPFQETHNFPQWILLTNNTHLKYAYFDNHWGREAYIHYSELEMYKRGNPPPSSRLYSSHLVTIPVWNSSPSTLAALGKHPEEYCSLRSAFRVPLVPPFYSFANMFSFPLKALVLTEWKWCGKPLRNEISKMCQWQWLLYTLPWQNKAKQNSQTKDHIP